MRKIYRIEIGNVKYWIGPGLQLVSQALAIPVTEEEHLMVMERIDVPAVAYSEAYHPEKHELARKLGFTMTQLQ